MAYSEERVWVNVEIQRGKDSAAFRGSMARTDFEEVVNGTFGQPFVALNQVHWVQSVWNEKERRFRHPVTVYGRDGEFRWNTGTMFLRADAILTLTVLHDSGELLGLTELPDDDARRR